MTLNLRSPDKRVYDPEPAKSGKNRVFDPEPAKQVAE